MDFDVTIVTLSSRDLELETSDSNENVSDDNPQYSDIPEEIWISIILYLEPLDILALGRSCKYFARHADNDHVWRHQWVSMSAEVPWLGFPSIDNLSTLGVQFKDACRRLWSIVSVDGARYPKCVHCKASFKSLVMYFHALINILHLIVETFL